MRWKKLRNLVVNLSAVAAPALLVIVVTFCIRAQFGSNDYVEWKSDDSVGAPAEPDDWTKLNPSQSAEWTRKFEAWNRKRWSVHIRANPNAIFAFGRQPFFGYPANSFSIHFYYWFIIPALMVWPLTRAATLLVRRARHIEGAIPCPNCGYDLRASLGPCPECGAEPRHKFSTET